jgi:site-specific recombinase XerD
VRCRGKGRKERCTPLRKEVIAALTSWSVEQKGKASDPLFPNARGGHLSRRGVEYLLCKHVDVASKRCTSLKNKNISPHVLRHTTAMELLQHGVDRSVIALWLGVESHDNIPKIQPKIPRTFAQVKFFRCIILKIKKRFVFRRQQEPLYAYHPPPPFWGG